MKHAAEPVPLESPMPSTGTRILPLPVDDAGREAREQLVRRLAADRLRDLRDDGVTVAYVARMYGVETAEIERLHGDLLPLRTR
ncbi:MAG TPA: hypothetical protein VF746_02705 [Longimicrobium sp.]|jgi:hypothetical protein